jgi:hypothetical protein
VEGFCLFAIGRTNKGTVNPPAGFSSLGDWVCPRMFFLGSEHTEINTTGFYF